MIFINEIESNLSVAKGNHTSCTLEMKVGAYKKQYDPLVHDDNIYYGSPTTFGAYISGTQFAFSGVEEVVRLEMVEKEIMYAQLRCVYTFEDGTSSTSYLQVISLSSLSTIVRCYGYTIYRTSSGSIKASISRACMGWLGSSPEKRSILAISALPRTMVLSLRITTAPMVLIPMSRAMFISVMVTSLSLIKQGSCIPIVLSGYGKRGSVPLPQCLQCMGESLPAWKDWYGVLDRI